MSKYEYISLSREDQEELNRFYADNPTSGGFRFSLSRSPDFFDALEVEGGDADVFAMRNRETKEIICCMITSEKRCYIRSEETTVSYISSLRIAEPYRSRLGGFFAGAVHQRHLEKGRNLSIASIFEDNTHARKNLLSEKGKLPAVKDMGAIHTLLFRPLKKAIKLSARGNVRVRTAQTSDIASLVAFLNENGKGKTFFPVYHESHFNADSGLLRDLRMEDIALAFEDNDLCGVMGRWDQMRFRQWQIQSYSFYYKWFRPLLNFYLKLQGKPRLPAAGKPVKYRNLAVVCIKNDDDQVFMRLLLHHVERMSDKNTTFAWSAHESNPFLKCFPLPCLDFRSRLILSYRKEGEQHIFKDDPGEIYLETGGL